MGRHSTRQPMTTDQALAIMAYDIADMIDRADNYDGLIPPDALSQDDLIELLPGLFRAAGFDPFAAATDPAEAMRQRDEDVRLRLEAEDHIASQHYFDRCADSDDCPLLTGGTP
jgi:hypothetical protein